MDINRYKDINMYTVISPQTFESIALSISAIQYSNYIAALDDDDDDELLIKVNLIFMRLPFHYDF